MNGTTYGVDIAKSVFQLHWVEPDTGEIRTKKLTRAKFIEFFAARLPARVVIEACGGAHHWARTLMAQGHCVELLPARQVRAFVRGNKDDAADARAIYLAAQRADLRRVPVKTAEQQAQLTLHRIRSHWMAVRTATVNMLRGLLYEFGVVLPKGRLAGLRSLAEHRGQADTQLPPLVSAMLDEQLRALRQLDDQIDALDRQIEAAQRGSETARKLRKIPGIGVLGATALAATLGDGSSWHNGREFASCLGLTPKHTGTGGKVRMGGISKRGDAYLRTLLIHGARNLVRATSSPAIVSMLQRRPFNVVAVAVAHKIARTAWAVVMHGREYDAGWKSQPPRTPSDRAMAA